MELKTVIPNIHILMTPGDTDSAGELMKRLGQRYVQFINRKYQRSGTLWEGRFRSCVTQDENYFLVCQRYIELNPVRAGIVAHPADYRWSSYRAHAEGEELPLLDHHPLYESLGRSVGERQEAYRELFRDELKAGVVDEIRRATNGNFVL